MTASPGLYIHIPFCSSKCPYCSFFSTPHGEEYFDRYLSACILELSALPKMEFDTLYIGGGTPSVLGGKRLREFVEAVLRLIFFKGVEFTVEVNPESAKSDFINALKDIPVTRLSVGVQSLNDNVLKLLGRIHSAEDAIALIVSLRKGLSVEINADVIYDIPGVAYDKVSETLPQLTEFSLEHISAYSYSPDTGYLTASAKDDPSEFLAVEKFLEEKGYLHYEVSNYAQPGFHSKHNIKYWEEREYIGIGAGAHSMIIENGSVYRYSHKPDIENYIKDPINRDDCELLDNMTVLKEALVFGLRLRNGIDLLEITERYGKLPEDILAKLDFLEKKEMLKCHGGKVAATKKGFLLLDSVTSYLW